MTSKEWMDIGISKGIIDALDVPDVSFEEAYHAWFLMKKRRIKPQSLDRIEVTYHRYYASSEFSKIMLSRMDERCISDFLTAAMLSYPMSYKEFGRLYQVVNNVLTYALDMNIGAVRLINWSLVKRYLPEQELVTCRKKECSISASDVERLFRAVLVDKIYYEKQSACLCLLLNFFLGLRIGELASLTWQDVDFERRLLQVRKNVTKYYERDSDGNKVGAMMYRISEDMKTSYAVRELPMTEDALQLLQLLKLHHENMGYDSPFLCYDGKPGAVLVRSLDRTLRRLCVLAELPHINSHLIRKTFASTLHDANVPTRMISDLLGHADISTTQKYYILSKGGNYNELRNRMDEALCFSKCI